jgi:hypothetical protein
MVLRPLVHFSQVILGHSALRMAVLSIQVVYWSDWGEPRRLLLDLARFGHQRSQDPAQQAMLLETTLSGGEPCDGRADRARPVG